MKKSEVEEDLGHGEATGVQHFCFNSSTTCKGREATMQQADEIF